MTPEEVTVVDVNGPALDWLKSMVLVNVVVGLVVVLLLTSLLVVTLWRGA